MRALATTLLAATLATAHAAPVRAAQDRTAYPPGRALDATFVQLTSAAAARPRAEWERLFADLRAAGIGEVFVQWTWADGVAFYAAGGGARTAGAPPPAVELILELAERHGQRVWLGLAHEPGWWAGIDRSRPADEVRVFLARRRLVNLGVARVLAASAATRPSFAGWYLPDEIDDRNWLGDERGALVADYVAGLATGLRALAPGAPLAVSGFGQGWATPERLAALWSRIATRAELALVLFQDGVGASKLTLDELAVYLPPLRAALEKTTARLGVVVELFAERPRAPGTETPFSAGPAPLARIERQIALARRFATGPLVAFSMPDYMSEFAGGEAAGLYAAYRAWREGCEARR
jgi:hypothetical protein